VRREPVGRNDVRIVEGLDEELLPTANSHQPSSLYSGPRPTNPKPHSDWTTKWVPLSAISTPKLISRTTLCQLRAASPKIL